MKLPDFPSIRPHWLRKLLFLIIILPITGIYLYRCIALHAPEIFDDMRHAWRGSEEPK